MALIMQKSRFLHTPKTGGTWVRRAIRNARIVHASTEREQAHVDLTNCPGSGLFTIAFVRHPWAWWKSYWVFKQKHGWDDKNPFDRACGVDHFERFLVGVLENEPGRCSQVFELFTGPSNREIEFVGRFERLVDDLIRGLSAAREVFDEEAIRRTRPENVGDYQHYSTACSAEVRARILAAERPALERFGYDEFDGGAT
jgi:hypothetical protein